MTKTNGKRRSELLASELDAVLASCKVKGDWLAVDSWEPMWKFGRELCKYEPWQQHLDASDIFPLVARILRERKISAPPDTTVELGSKLNKQQFDQLSEAVRSYLASIPRRYELRVALPSMPKWGEGTFVVSEGVSIAETKQSEEKGIAAVLKALVRSSPTDGVYLKISAEGYGTSSLSSTATSEAIAHLKQFLQMFRRNKAFKYEHGGHASGFQAGKVLTELVDLQSPSDAFPIELPDSLKQFLATISIDESKLEWRDFSKGLFEPGRPASSREEKVGSLKLLMGWITTILDCPNDWPDAMRIRTALEWGFDSEQNDNQTLALIQAAVGLEALLGDDDRDEPLTTRLADRCAYLLGKTHKDRMEIRANFKAMYEVRSKVIHGRARRLVKADAEQLRFAQWTLGELITAEANNLIRALSTVKKP